MKKLLSQPTSYFTKQPNLGEWEESQRQASSSVNPARKICSARDGFCWRLWQRRLHFVDEKAKVDAAYYVSHLLPKLVDWVYLSAGRWASAYGTHSAGLAPGKLDFIAKDQWPPNSPDPLNYHVWGRCWRPITSSIHSKTKVNHRTQGSAACDLGRPSTETNRQGCQKLFKTIEKMRESWRWTFRTLEVNANAWQIVHCDV